MAQKFSVVIFGITSRILTKNFEKNIFVDSAAVRKAAFFVNSIVEYVFHEPENIIKKCSSFHTT